LNTGMAIRKTLTVVAITGISIVLCEVALRVLLFFTTPSCMVFDKDICYTYKPHCSVGSITMNNFGCIGDDMGLSKGAGETRVLLLGGSTSFSREYVDGVKWKLSAFYPGRNIKVASCGRPRYTSYINKVNLEKNLLAYKPDIIALYMGINDNIYNTFYWMTGLPDVGYFNWRDFKASILYKMLKYHMLDKRLLSRPHFGKDELRSTAIFRENVSAIIDVAKANRIKVVLSTFAIALPSDDEKVTALVKSEEKKMQHFWGDVSSTVVGVEEHNRLTKDLSRTYGLPMADNYALIPKSSEYFVDICHLSARGIEMLSSTMAEAIGTEWGRP
jgi:hypothetical protein